MLVKSQREDDHFDDLKETFDTLRSYNMKLNPSKYAFGVTVGKLLGFMVSQRGIEINLDKIQAIMEMAPPRNTKEVQCLNDKVVLLNKFVSRATDKCLPFFCTLKKSFEWTFSFQGFFFFFFFEKWWKKNYREMYTFLCFFRFRNRYGMQ